MKDKFQMSSMGELTFFLGLQVKQKKDGIFISQDKYVAEILKKFGLSEGKSASTLIDAEKPLLKDTNGEDVDVHIYRSMIGSLMYLTSSRPDIMFASMIGSLIYLTASRPDIMFAVYACARHQVTPKECHLQCHLHAFKRIFRFRRGTADKTLFIKKDKCDILLVQVYGDDIIFESTKKFLCDEFEQMMHKRFQMSSMRELTFLLGLHLKQKDDGIFINQDKYMADSLKKFDFTTVKITSTPMEPNKALIKDTEAKDVDAYLYRSMIRSLMYLTASRPNIMFAVCACARFQVTPKTSHLYAVKRIFRYLKGQPKLGLWYPRDSSFDLEAFSDSNYARASLDRKSTT
nr:uncharacterized mitochondrial protein AtMg00810-like [Tanacetum cinerariifolium]